MCVCVCVCVYVGLPWWLSGKESSCNAGDPGSTPELRRSPGWEHGNPFWYASLENPMDRGAWWATTHRVAKSTESDTTEWLRNNNNKYICCCCCCLVASVVSDSVRSYGLQPTRFLCPWDSLGKSTGVGCHPSFRGSSGPNMGLLGGSAAKRICLQCRRCRNHGFDSWVRKISWQAIIHRVTKSCTQLKWI